MITAKTIPEALNRLGLTQTELSRQLNVNRATILKYKDDLAGAGHAIVNGILMTRTMINQSGRVKAKAGDLLEERRKLVRELVSTKNGVKCSDIEALFKLKKARASLVMKKIVSLGDVFKTGNNSASRYWVDEAHYLANCQTHREIVPRHSKLRKTSEEDLTPKYKVRKEPSPIVFLSKKRPDGVNTVFDECRENCKVLLPVFEVMAGRRRYG